jgi:thiol-disulfide isomerase/thioredoxin
MDRLSVVVLVSALALACDEKNAATQQQPGRVDAVHTRTSKKTWSDVCDVAPTAPSALKWPQLTGELPGSEGARYRWVNVWASWCKPCIEELPLLTHTFSSWRERGQTVALTLLSVDADANSAEKFLAGRPGLPASARLQDASAAPGWLTELGLVAGTSIPVHLILDAQDKLLCVRAGSLAQRDLEHFQKLLFP